MAKVGARLAILFDIDGTLIDTGGAGAGSWRLAFDELYGVPAELTRVALRRASLTNGAEVSAAQAIVVGDTPHDVDSAHAAGLECVGVGSHKFDAGALRDAGADYAIASLADGLPPGAV